MGKLRSNSGSAFHAGVSQAISVCDFACIHRDAFHAGPNHIHGIIEIDSSAHRDAGVSEHQSLYHKQPGKVG